MLRGLGPALLAGALVMAAAGTAAAAEPNNQACLGVDFSTYARYGAPGPVLVYDAGDGFGQFNAWLAQQVPGLGLPIQLHLAGYVSDGYLTNACSP